MRFPELQPPVRIVTLLVAATGMMVGGWAAVGISAGAVVLTTPDWGRLPRQLLVVARRVRWLLLSIGVFYGWFTSPDWSLWPDQAALVEGGRRAAIILIMALGAQRLLASLPAERVAAALLWLLAPLARIGLPVRRACLRIVLVFRCLDEIGALRPQESAAESRWQRIAEGVSAPLRLALERAERAPLPRLELPPEVPPPGAQWLLPSILGLAFVGL